MFDIDEIRKQALASMRETMEKNEERISKIEVPSSEKGASVSAAEVEEQIAANTQRQVEILGQMFGPDSMAQMAVNEELLQKMVNDKVAEATSATAGDLMGQLFGEDMGILAAALETLEMEDADDEEELSFDLELEEKLYTTLEETMARLEAMPEPEAIPYQKDDVNGNALASCCPVFYRPLTVTIWIVWMWRNIFLLWSRKSCPSCAAPGG